MANGEIDLMEIGPSADKYNKAKVIPGVDIRVAGGPNFRHLTMNGQSPMLQDVKVRQALAMGIDRAAIAKAQLGSANEYMKIFEANRDQLSDPDNIKPGQVLNIP